MKVLNWFLLIEAKVNKYLVCYFSRQIEEPNMVYLYQVNGKDQMIVIRHLNVQMDIEALSLLQMYIKFFYNYLQNLHLTTKTSELSGYAEKMLYKYLKTKWKM